MRRWTAAILIAIGLAFVALLYVGDFTSLWWLPG